MLAYAQDRSSIGKCKRRWLNALEWWLPGGAGLRMVALCYWGMRLEVSMVVRCYWGMALQVFMVVRCYQGISLQVVRRIGMVASRWCWVADGGAMLLGNVIRGFHGGAVLLGVSMVVRCY